MIINVEGVRTNCYFFAYSEASRKFFCKYYGVFDDCPCAKCGKFIACQEAENLIRRYVDETRR